MSPKEKAKELYDKMRREEYPLPAKWCALVAVDEIIEVISTVYEHDWNILYPYWTEVKQEIENI